jgi:hypothetical protein
MAYGMSFSGKNPLIPVSRKLRAIVDLYLLSTNQEKTHTPDKVNYAQQNTAWTPQQGNSVSEVRAYILEL